MPRSLLRVSYQDLIAEMRRRQRSVGALEVKRKGLLQKLRHLESQIQVMGGAGGNGRAVRPSAGGRARNSLTLTATLEKILSNRTMSVVDAAEAVKKAGYRTNSNSFRTQVNIALIKSGKFKRVGRGQYTVK